MNGAEIIQTLRGKIPDMVFWLILTLIAVIILQKDNSFQDLQIAQAYENIEKIQQDVEDTENSCSRTEEDWGIRYEDLIQRLARIEQKLDDLE